MRAILNRIFLAKLGLSKFIFSALAFAVGLSLVLLSLQGYFKIKEYIAPNRNASNYIILTKEVGLTNTLFGGKAQFNIKEVTDLKQQPFVEDMGVFKASRFQAIAHLGGSLGFYTELFFESVPPQFIDNKPSDFVWDEGDEFLPIIISQDFLNLYNFGYAMGKGTPQLSKSTISLVPLTVNIYGPYGKLDFRAKVVGFSDRISSILVPDNFLTWANKELVHEEPNGGSRIIVRLKNEKASFLNEYLAKHDLKISDEKLNTSKILATINIVMTVLIVVGSAFMVFSLVIVMLNFSLMIAQAKEEVYLLLQLGYKIKHISNHLTIYLLIFMSSVVLLSTGLFTAGNYYLLNFFRQYGIAVKNDIPWVVIFVTIGVIVASISGSLFSIRRVISNAV